MTIDNHQYFWKYHPVKDAWIDDSIQIIRKDFLPHNLKPVLNKNNVEGCIVVQADQSEIETDIIYATIVEKPKNFLFLKNIVPNKESSIQLLRKDKPLEWNYTENKGLEIKIPSNILNTWSDKTYAWAFKVMGKEI